MKYNLVNGIVSKFKKGASNQPTDNNGNKKVAPITPKRKPYTVLKEKPNLSAVSKHEHFLLIEMCTHMRPHGSDQEKLFCETYIAPIASYQDAFGNYHKIVGENPRTMFTAHTDSVHVEAGYQNLQYDATNEILYADNSSCLGTDDATGVYIMLRMIESDIEGHYVFTRGEEVGCLGSQWMKTNTPKVFDNINVAVAFDRKGYNDVITEQSTGKCASQTAAQQLVEMLNNCGLDFDINPNGVYTDTAHFNGLVSECFNLSVGYFDQHTEHESQDLGWLTTFIDACCNIDWGNIRPVREVTDFGWMSDDFSTARWNRHSANPYGSMGGWYDAASPEEIVAVFERDPLLVAGYLSREGLLTVADIMDLNIDLDMCEEIEIEEAGGMENYIG